MYFQAGLKIGDAAMKKHVYFPEGAFRKKGFMESLTARFRKNAYRAEDVGTIRTSLHYRNFRSEGAEHKYETAMGFAHRRQDGLFAISVLRASVSANTVRGDLHIVHLPDHESRNTCAAHEVITTMRALENQLAKDSIAFQSYPRSAPLRYGDALHIDAAAMIFAEPATYYDIESNIHRNMIRDGAGLYLQPQ